MDSRLYQASLKGDVNTLHSLIDENSSILENATVGRLNQNPLHIAASVGHLAFSSALLSLNPNPELATKSDSRGRFPLHLASEKGHVEIVRELLLHPNDAVCLQVGKEGRIPLHLAAVQGHVDVIKELIGARPESINMVVTNKEMELKETKKKTKNKKKKNKEMELIGARPESIYVVTNKEMELTGETVLHLCVRYNRLEALKLLLDLAPSDSLVSAQDDDGNTVLHLAAALKNTEIIKYLLSLPDVKELLASMKNKKNFTALDVLERSTITDDKSIEIQDILLQAGVSRAQKIEGFLSKYLEKYWAMEYPRMDESWLKESRGHLITTSTVIATVAFQAGVTPPGGVWQDDGNGTIQGSHEAGTSIIATKNLSLHTYFVYYNTFSFATSLIVILLLISGVAFKNNVLMRLLNIAMFYSVISMVLAYSVSVQMMIPGTDSAREGTYLVFIRNRVAFICYFVFLFVTLPYAISISEWVTSELCKLKGKMSQLGHYLKSIYHRFFC